MEKAEEAEKMAEDYRANPPKFNGKRLTIYVSRKYRQLKYGYVSSSVKQNHLSELSEERAHAQWEFHKGQC